MTVLVVGSVAYDSVTTQTGRREKALGGSATYFSISGSYFTPVSVIGVVGDDFLPAHMELMEAHRVDTSGIERRPGKTFHWSGVYGTEDVNTRETLDTQLNVFADFSPELRPRDRMSPYLFLANIDPELQLDVLNQMDGRPQLVALDTMNFWIEGKRAALAKVVEAVDILFMDEGEVRAFAGEINLVKAARSILEMGPQTVVIKRGEHGVLLFRKEDVFAAPAFPLEDVADPTGAGDSFAGGFIGYLAATGDDGRDAFRRAALLGSTMGSFAVESFSTDRIAALTKDQIEHRFTSIVELLSVAPMEGGELVPWRDG